MDGDWGYPISPITTHVQPGSNEHFKVRLPVARGTSWTPQGASCEGMDVAWCTIWPILLVMFSIMLGEQQTQTITSQRNRPHSAWYVATCSRFALFVDWNQLEPHFSLQARTILLVKTQSVMLHSLNLRSVAKPKHVWASRSPFARIVHLYYHKDTNRNPSDSISPKTLGISFRIL